MHLIGKEMKVTATLPDKSVRPVIWIKDWNFYWQDSYVYKDPLRLPKGTRLDLEAFYDNSSENPFNPSSPPRRVLFGNGTTDEMCFAIFQTVGQEQGNRRRVAGAFIRSMLDQWTTADLSPDARVKIMREAMNLFGRRFRSRPPESAEGKRQK
jgi:hypothetical protein